MANPDTPSKPLNQPRRRPLPSIVLCGYERGGTTLLSEIFRQNGYFSGFEVGVLMCDSPRDFMSFKPYCEMLHAGWGLGTRISLEELCSGTFEDFYSSLILTAYPRRANLPFFDKTPIYMSRLGAVLARTEFIKKAVVITRDPRGVFVSWARRQLGPEASTHDVEKTVRSRLNAYSKRYLDYFLGCITHRDNQDVLFISYEDLCLDPDKSLPPLGQFAHDQDFTLAKLEQRFKNVHGDKIDTAKAREFESFLSNATQRKVLESTSLAANFFASEEETARYHNKWLEKLDKVTATLERHGLSSRATTVAESYFEPETYLFRNPDVLKRQMDPTEHYRKHGAKEGRLAS